MQIDGLLVNADVQDIIDTLREQLAEQGLNRFEKVTDSGDDLMVQCPYHKNGQERRPSAGIRKSDGLFHCLACGETHSLPEVIGYCFGRNTVFGYKWITTNFGASVEQVRQPIILDLSREPIAKHDKVQTISDDELDSYRYIHPYMYERGLTDEIIDKFDIGYDKTTDSITFPVRDINGDCMFVARRAIKTKYFDIPKGVTKPLYGMYELAHTKGFGVKYSVKLYVCEGMFDCLRMWCNDKLAVAGFGCLFNSYQIKQLQDLPIRTIVLALDNDDAGRKAAERLKRLIPNKLIKIVSLPEGRKDIGECTNEEIRNLQENLY